VSPNNNKTGGPNEQYIGHHHNRNPALQKRGQEREATVGGISGPRQLDRSATLVFGSENSSINKHLFVIFEHTRRHINAMIKFTKIMWMLDMQQLLDIEQGESAFMSFLQREFAWEQREAQTMLRFVVEARKLGSNDVHIAEQLCKQYLSTGARDEVVQEGGAALELVFQELQHTLQDLSSDAFPRFLESAGCNKLMERLQQDKALAVDDVDSAVWSDYTIAEDVGYWVRMFISTAETFPVCIVISDMAHGDSWQSYDLRQRRVLQDHRVLEGRSARIQLQLLARPRDGTRVNSGD